VSKTDTPEKSRAVLWTAIAFGSIPILGLLASMPINYHNFGTPFTAQGEWNNLFLLLVTLPIAEFICGGNSRWLHSYAGVILYTLICTVLYALAGSLLALLVRGCVRTCNRGKKSD